MPMRTADQDERRPIPSMCASTVQVGIRPSCGRQSPREGSVISGSAGQRSTISDAGCRRSTSAVMSARTWRPVSDGLVIVNGEPTGADSLTKPVQPRIELAVTRRAEIEEGGVGRRVAQSTGEIDSVTEQPACSGARISLHDLCGWRRAIRPGSQQTDEYGRQCSISAKQIGRTSPRLLSSSVMPQRRSTKPKLTPRRSHAARRVSATCLISRRAPPACHGTWTTRTRAAPATRAVPHAW